MLRVYQELSHEQIANVLGSSVGAVKANFFHALGEPQTPVAIMNTHLRSEEFIDALDGTLAVDRLEHLDVM